MKKFKIGFFNLAGKSFLSSAQINKAFLKLLARYADVATIPLAKKDDLINKFKDIKKHKLDYLYVDSFNFLLQSFLFRERLQLDIRFIVKIHTLYYWIGQYMHIIPLLRDDDILFAPSVYARECFMRISNKFDVHIIPNFLDVAEIRRFIPARNTGKKRIISYLGRLTDEKGVGVLIECMPKVLSSVPNAHLNIIGPLSGNAISDSLNSLFVKQLKKQVRELNLIDRVHFFGLKLGQSKYKLLAKSDVLVNPTRAREETFGYVNIEALACGVPVIATKWAANQEIIKEGQNGYLIGIRNGKDFPKVDASGLTQTITEVLDNRKHNLRLKKNAFYSARQYDYRRILSRLLQLLQEKQKAITPGNWSLIKDKNIGDFSHLYNPAFLFFLRFYCRLRKARTYGFLYRALESKNSPGALEPYAGMKIRKKREGKIKLKIMQDLYDFLSLRAG